MAEFDARRRARLASLGALMLVTIVTCVCIIRCDNTSIKVQSSRRATELTPGQVESNAATVSSSGGTAANVREPGASNGCLIVAVRSATGVPIEGARVQSRGMNAQVSNEDGIVTLTQPASSLAATRVGYAPAFRQIVQGDYERGEVVITMLAESSVRGGVQDWDDNAIGGATIEVLYGYPVSSAGEMDELEIDTTDVRYLRKAVSNPDGRFEIHGLKAGRHLVRWRADGYVPCSVSTDKGRITGMALDIGDRTAHEELLRVSTVYVAAIEVVHKHALPSELLRWMLMISTGLPTNLDSMGAAFPELLGEYDQLVRGSPYDGYCYPIVAVATRPSSRETAPPKASFEVSFLEDAPRDGRVVLGLLKDWQLRRREFVARVDVGSRQILTGRVRITTPYAVDIVGKERSTFGVMPLASKRLDEEADVFIVELPEGEYYVAPSRFGMLHNRARRQSFLVTSNGMSEVSVPADQVARVRVFVDDEAGRPLAAYNLKVGSAESAVMVAGRSGFYPVVQFLEIGDTCFLQLWDSEFSRKKDVAFVVDKSVYDVHISL